MANSAVEKTISTQELKEKLLDVLHNDFQTTPEDASDQQVYEALSKIVVGILKAKRRKFTVKTQSEGKKKVYYLSMEFLMGRSLKTSLYNLELVDDVKAMLAHSGINLDKIYEQVKKIPYGRGATYGQIALLAGNPRWSRVVGYALHVNPDPENVRCYRVVNRFGEVSKAFAFGGENEQIRLLKSEGVEVDENGRVDLKKYGMV